MIDRDRIRRAWHAEQDAFDAASSYDEYAAGVGLDPDGAMAVAHEAADACEAIEPDEFAMAWLFGYGSGLRTLGGLRSTGAATDPDVVAERGALVQLYLDELARTRELEDEGEDAWFERVGLEPSEANAIARVIAEDLAARVGEELDARLIQPQDLASVAAKWALRVGVLLGRAR